jgi:hypothetical protein
LLSGTILVIDACHWYASSHLVSDFHFIINGTWFYGEIRKRTTTLVMSCPYSWGIQQRLPCCSCFTQGTNLWVLMVLDFTSSDMDHDWISRGWEMGLQLAQNCLDNLGIWITEGPLCCISFISSSHWDSSCFMVAICVFFA